MHGSPVDDQATAWVVVTAVADWWPGWLGDRAVDLEVWTPGTKVTTGHALMVDVAAGRVAQAEWWWQTRKMQR